MADVTKRLRYFDGQVLGAQDFTDEQHYVLDRQRRYSRFFNAAGIVDGLEVRQAMAPGQIEVRPGTALDAQGRQVVLSDARTVSLVERKSQTVELVIAYSQEEGDPQPTEAGPVGHTRFHEEPYVGPNSALPPGSTDPLTLARVTLDANGAVTQVDETPRVYAGIHLPDGKGTTGGVILRAHTRPDNLDQPGWHDVTYAGAWVRFDATHNPTQYLKDNKGIVYLRGMIQGGTIGGTNDAGMAFTLPEGYRPAHRQLHVVCTYNNALGRVDVLANGNVVVVSGNTAWVSLDGIAFQAADSPDQAAWQDVTYTGAWVRYGTSYNPVQYFKDKQGIVYLRGMIQGGTTGFDNDAGRAFTLPEGYCPTHRQLHVVCTSDPTVGRVDVAANGNLVVVSGNTAWVSLDGIAFRAADSSAQADWQDVNYVNSWQRYSTTYNPAQYWKDSQGIVHLRGLMRGGTPGDNDAGRAFTLPEGNRPTYRQLHVVCTNNNRLGRVDVLANGNVVVVSGDSGWMSLDSIAFRAADSLASKGPAEEVLPRIVSGVVDGTGTAQAAVGFTVTKVETGLYDITFAPPFAAIPAASVTQIWTGSEPSDTRDNAILVSLEQTKMRVKTGNNTGAPTDRSFSFIAIGPR